MFVWAGATGFVIGGCQVPRIIPNSLTSASSTASTESTQEPGEHIGYSPEQKPAERADVETRPLLLAKSAQSFGKQHSKTHRLPSMYDGSPSTDGDANSAVRMPFDEAAYLATSV